MWLLITNRQKNSTVSVDIRPRIFSFALLQKNIRNDIVEVTNHLEQGIIRHVLQTKFSLADVTWVCFTKNSMSITWDNLEII